MFIINTARKYQDLDYRGISLGLFESESSPVDIAENLDFLLEEKADYEITTLNEAVINRIGYLIDKRRLNCEEVEIRIFEDGRIKSVAHYDKEGYLDNGWINGLYEPDNY